MVKANLKGLDFLNIEDYDYGKLGCITMSKKFQINYALDRLPSVEQAYNLFSVIRLSQENLRTIYNHLSKHCFNFNSDQTCSSIIKFLFKLELLIILGLSIGFSIYSIFTSPKSLKLYLNKHIDMSQYLYILYNNGHLKNLIENTDLIENKDFNRQALGALDNYNIQKMSKNEKVTFEELNEIVPQHSLNKEIVPHHSLTKKIVSPKELGITMFQRKEEKLLNPESTPSHT